MSVGTVRLRDINPCTGGACVPTNCGLGLGNCEDDSENDISFPRHESKLF